MTNAVQLRKGEFLRLQVERAGRRLEVVEGTVWVTISGCPEDLILKKGDGIELPKGTLVLAESLEESALLRQIEPCAAAAWIHWPKPKQYMET